MKTAAPASPTARRRVVRWLGVTGLAASGVTSHRASRASHGRCARAAGAGMLSDIMVSDYAPPAATAGHCTHNRGVVDLHWRMQPGLDGTGAAEWKQLTLGSATTSLVESMATSMVSRRDFLRLSAGTLGAAGAISPPATRAGDRDHVAIVIDPADRAASVPPVAWAMDQLEAALSQHAVALQRFRAIGEVPQTTRCIVAATPAMSVAKEALREAGVAPPAAPESLALLTTSFAGRQGLLACGADSRGLTYALLELADRIRCGQRPAAAMSFDVPLVE